MKQYWNAHFCPKCDADLTIFDYHGWPLEIVTCPKCNSKFELFSDNYENEENLYFIKNIGDE